DSGGDGPPGAAGGQWSAAPRRCARNSRDFHTDPRLVHRADDRGHARGPRVIYLDTSAAYKLLSREPGVAQVESLFESGRQLLSSRLLEVELHATVLRRGGSEADVNEIVNRVDLDTVDDEVIDHALSFRSGPRAMDALHLSMALLYGQAMTAMSTFDPELGPEAPELGPGVRG